MSEIPNDDAGVRSLPQRPQPARPLNARLREWVAWFGPGRLAVTAASVVAIAVGGAWLLRSPQPPVEAGLPRAGTTVPGTSAPSTTAGADVDVAGASSTRVPGTVVVHVAGAVAAPGVYHLPDGARVDDAVHAAGGPLTEADPGGINLAAPVDDGMRIYVPRTGEPVPAPVAAATASTAAAGPVDLNTATAEQLDALPGVGPSTAAAIVAHRQASGPFATVDDLADVRGIGPAKLEAIRALVTV